jgi:hypothetical protein
MQSFPLRFLFAAHPDALTHVMAVVQRGRRQPEGRFWSV